MAEGNIDAAIIVDRSVDTATLFISQMTYQGLLDEAFRIVYSYIEVHPSLLDSSVSPDEPMKNAYRRLRDDEYFGEIKGMNIKKLGIRLKNDLIKAKEEAHKVREDTEMDKLDIIKKLKVLDTRIKTIEMHLNLSYTILKRLSDESTREKLSLEKVAPTLTQGHTFRHTEQGAHRQDRRLYHSA